MSNTFTSTVTIVTEIDCQAPPANGGTLRLVLWFVDGALNPDLSFEEERCKAIELLSGFNQGVVLETARALRVSLEAMGFVVEMVSTCND